MSIHIMFMLINTQFILQTGEHIVEYQYTIKCHRQHYCVYGISIHYENGTIVAKIKVFQLPS